jgi:hypothetical protein
MSNNTKLFYVSKQDIQTIFNAIDVLDKISIELENKLGAYDNLTINLNMSLFYLKSFLKEFRRYVKPLEAMKNELRK